MRRSCTHGKKSFGSCDPNAPRAATGPAVGGSVARLTSGLWPCSFSHVAPIIGAHMVRFALACFMLCALWLYVTPACAGQSLPGSRPNGVVRPHAVSKQHHPAKKSQGKRHAHSSKPKRSAITEKASGLVRRSEPGDAPVSDAKPRSGAASEFTVTPHMWMEFGATGRL